MEKTTDKPLTRDALVSMQVIDAKGRLIGKVKDLAFSVGKNGIALTVENDRWRNPNRRMGRRASRSRLHPSKATDGSKHISANSSRSSTSPTSPSTDNATDVPNMW